MASNESEPNLRDRTNRRIGRSLIIGLALVSFMAPMVAQANDGEPQNSKSFWQDRYRGLIARAAKLRATIGQERELYADANRRNYRRGNKRHIHREAMEEAISELAIVEAELATIEEDGRRAGALPGWFYEVEIEFEDADGRPAISAGPGDEGRNPLYLEKR